MAQYTNSGYTPSQIASMQQDAMRRVNEMQRISREKLNATNQNQSIHQHPPPPPEKRDNSPQQIPNINGEVISNGYKGLLDRLNLNEEKIIILVMLFLLLNEGADTVLILALIYIML